LPPFGDFLALMHLRARANVRLNLRAQAGSILSRFFHLVLAGDSKTPVPRQSSNVKAMN
jgi:hypothetical protein